ncbi:radical SAM protein [Candidatus Bipolaricaulota bacterium]|nr:radical SAM protein [Candidatus Bipolaricaulota bacterium]
MIVFGPVPSRRLGRSLGINNIPPKICTYSCAYCQLGNTISMQAARRAFYGPENIMREVSEKIRLAGEAHESIDYLSFVPDGEPTLDINLGRTIQLLKTTRIKIAVISNASLIYQKSVRDDLVHADWVSLKVDAVDEAIWRKLDRPHKNLRLSAILAGARKFSELYTGKLVTETMLIEGVNDRKEHIEKLGQFLAGLIPNTAYLSIPTRPPAETWAHPPSEVTINRAYHILSKALKRVELLTGYEGNAFALTGDVKEDLLNITAVHPMRKTAIQGLLAKAQVGWDVVQELVDDSQLVETRYNDATYYIRSLRDISPRQGSPSPD